MSRIYETHNSAGSLVGLYYREYNTKFPYVVMADNRTVAEADYLADAYRLYNEVAK